MSRSRRPLLSVCMIVRDEAHTLPRCLRSLGDIYDELCIVDTGSSDNTLGVAEEFGARVERYTACNGPDGQIVDFAAARNRSFDMASGAYILWVDADEVLGKAGAVHIRQHARKAKYSAIRVSMRWDSSRWYAPRLVRNRPEHRFVGRVHEGLTLGPPVTNDARIVVVNKPDKTGKEDSNQRTIRISRTILLERPDDLHTLFYLGNALKGEGQYAEAITCYARYLELGGNYRCERYMAAFHLAGCHLMRQEWELAVGAGLRALRVDPRYAETHCLLGDAHIGLGDLEAARMWFKCALAVKRPPDDATLFVNLAAYGRYPRLRMQKCEAALK